MYRFLSFFILLQLVSGSQLDFPSSAYADYRRSLVEREHLHCANQAAEEFLSQCGDYGLDALSSKLRLQSAVKLSLCELADAQVSVPSECLILDTIQGYHLCVQQFRQSSQLWTTYSGHYRKLRTLCYEEALPHTKTNILDLFFNITSLYSTFYQAAHHSSEDIKNKEHEAQIRLQNLVDVVSSAITTMESRTARSEEALEGLVDKLQQKSKGIERLWDTTSRFWDENALTVEQHFAVVRSRLEDLVFLGDETSLSVSMQHHDFRSQLSASFGKALSQMALVQESSELLQSSLDHSLSKSESLNHWFDDADERLLESFNAMKGQSKLLVANISAQLHLEVATLSRAINSDFGNMSARMQTLCSEMGGFLYQFPTLSSSLSLHLEKLAAATNRLEHIDFGTLFRTRLYALWYVCCAIMGATLVVLTARTFAVTRKYANAVIGGTVSALCVRLVFVFFYNRNVA